MASRYWQSFRLITNCIIATDDWDGVTWLWLRFKVQAIFFFFFQQRKRVSNISERVNCFRLTDLFLQIWLCCLKNKSVSHLVGSCGGSTSRSSGFMSSRSRVRIQTVFLLFFTMSRRSRALIPLEDSLYPLHISFISRSMIRSCQVSNIIAKLWINFVTKLWNLQGFGSSQFWFTRQKLKTFSYLPRSHAKWNWTTNYTAFLAAVVAKR